MGVHFKMDLNVHRNILTNATVALRNSEKFRLLSMSEDPMNSSLDKSLTVPITITTMYVPKRPRFKRLVIFGFFLSGNKCVSF